jgi:type IV pilus assembly protein PilM
MNTSGLLYRQKPLFGFDLGHGSIKVVQVELTPKKTTLLAYGSESFNPNALKEGQISDYDTLAKAAHNLIEKHLTGAVTTNRVAASLPVLHSFSRIINLPMMPEKDIHEAVHQEAEQYIPVPLGDLYLYYQLVDKTPESMDYLVAAAPKKVVDSYMTLFEALGLELVAMEPSILSVTRIVQHAEDANLPTLVIDCGSVTTDLIIFNKSVVRVTGTIKFGGETLTEAIKNKFGVSTEEARNIKRSYGLDPGEKQAEIVGALAGTLNFLVSEIKKIIRYFEERDKDENAKVQQIIILGGGANLPGFSTYLTSELRVPVRLASIWHHFSTDHIKPPDRLDTSMYATAAGLALIKPGEAAE